MKIGMVLAGRDYPPDIRVEKEVRALQARGHQCVVICENPGGKPFRSEWDGSIIYRVSKAPTLPRKINSLFFRLFFLNFQWYLNLLQISKAEHLDVLHVHDLPLSGTTLAAGSRLKVPVLIDLHENFPAALKYYGTEPKTLSRRLLGKFNQVGRWQRYEIRAAQKADRVIVVVDEAKTRLIGLGIDPDKIAVIENTIDIPYFQDLGKIQGIQERFKDDFLISYIGGYGGRHRGLDTAIEAMPRIIREIPTAKLLLVGKGSIKPELERQVKRLKLEDQVIFEDWRPFEEVPSYIQASQICLIPHHSNPHTEATSPHKLFQYMLMERPVVVSSCKPLKRVVEETQSGLVFRAGDHEHLAKTILQLKGQELRDELGQSGKKAVLDRYNWENTSRDLIRLYENL